MDEMTLRRWALGTLPSQERRDVSRWLVRCTDPALPALLHGILQDARDEQADAVLRRRGPLWTRLADAWQQLIDDSTAFLSSGQAAIALAEAGGPPPPPLQLAADRLHVSVPSGVRFALYVTDDNGRAETLCGPEESTGDRVVGVPRGLGARATFWLVWGAQLPVGEPLDVVGSARGQGASVFAVRQVEP